MKYSKAVFVTLEDIKGNLNRRDDVCVNNVAKSERPYSNFDTNYEIIKDFSCQYDSNRNHLTCTCKRMREPRYFSTSRQVYRSLRYTSARGFTDVGVGNVKTVPRKRVRRIYLPDTEDRGVGSDDLTSFIRRTKNEECYYEQKRTSSKCVGGAVEHNHVCVLSENLSPILQTKSGSTSPIRLCFEENKNCDNHLILPDPVVNLVMGKKQVRGDKTNSNKKQQGASISQETLSRDTNTRKINEVLLPNTSKIIPTTLVIDEDVADDFSSDSLIQHVYNLEDPSSYKRSKMSLEEIKLEGDSIKKFPTKSSKPTAEIKPIQDISKSSSIRKRFEALRRGLSKKENSKEQCIIIKSSSHNSAPSRKDVSITSDPPSLEARSFTDTKQYSPIPLSPHKYVDVSPISYRTPVTDDKGSSQWSTQVVDGEYQNAKGMFKLWGKKFKLDDDNFEITSFETIPDTTKKQKKKVEIILPKEEVIKNETKERKRFLFFKRKSKDKSKQPYKSKKGVTTGRCEVGDGLTIKIGTTNKYSSEAPSRAFKQMEDAYYDDMLRKAWLKRYLYNKNNSQSSVKIRWNNDMYTTSSSTVFELMECIYKNTEIVFSSKSEVTFSTVPSTSTGGYYRSYKNPQVNFMQQTIQAWMMPKTTTDNNIEKSLKIQNWKKEKNKNTEVTLSNQKWFIDKSKAFSQKIELVLNSKNYVRDAKVESSKYIVIDIPKGYFSENSSDDQEQNQTSDEQVFNIVEYETVKSSSYLKNKRSTPKIVIKEHKSNDIRVTINVKDMGDEESRAVDTVIKTSPLHRDVVVQGSNVYIPKRCDVIGVGIITQHTHNRDLKDIVKPKLKMQDEITDEESTHAVAPQKKCELAESYLQEYYRHWTPLGMDLYSWCISDLNLRGSSDNNSLNSMNYQGDASKSCPNICDDYQTSAIVSSCETSSCSNYIVFDGTNNSDEATTTYYNKLQKNSEDPLQSVAGARRVLPKDSVEVFKRRKIYATSNKGNWGTNCEGIEPFSIPSVGHKFSQKTSNEFCKSDYATTNPSTKEKKHVSLKDLEEKSVTGILSFKGSSECNKKEISPKPVRVNPKPVGIPVPACEESCTKLKKPPCLKKESPIKPPSNLNRTKGSETPPRLPSSLSSCPPCCSKSSLSQLQQQSPPYKEQNKKSCLKKDSPIKPPYNLNRTKGSGTPPRLPPSSLSSCPPCCSKSSLPQIQQQSPAYLKQNKSPCSIKGFIKNSLSGKYPPVYAPHLDGSPVASPSPSVPSSPRRRKSSPTRCRQESNSPGQRSPPQSIQECSCNPLKSCGSLRCLGGNKSSNSCEALGKQKSESSLKIPASGNLIDACKRLTKKINSCMANKESGCFDDDCPKKANETKKETAKGPCPLSPCCIASKSLNSSPITGIHLKSIPRNWSNGNHPNCQVIKLNSKENIFVRVKTLTPSTDEIRDDRNIKIQDEDGQTLYERHEYKMDNKNDVMKEMYRDSRIHRVSTSMVINEKNFESCESNTSLSNIIEINFNLKLKPADKATEVNIKKDMPKDMQNKKTSSQACHKDVYILQDETKQSTDRIEIPEKRDVNIKIVINSYRQNSNKSKQKMKCPNLQAEDKFTKKISQKFQTVSTGYSDVLDNMQTYSLHKTTLNSSDHTDTSNHLTKSSEELDNEVLSEKNLINATENGSSTKPFTLKNSGSLLAANKVEKVQSQVLPSDISQITGISATDNEDTVASDIQNSNVKLPKIRDKQEKKQMLKQIFESSDNPKNAGNKSKMRSIRQMLRAVLTSDSSGCEDVTVNHELAKELTYQSLKPNFFKDSESMTNYYQFGSSMSDNSPSKNEIDKIFPTERNSTDVDESDGNQNLRCKCNNNLATTLKMCKNNLKTCCCLGADKRDKEVDCNIKTQDVLPFKKTENVHVGTQASYLERKNRKSVVTIASNTVIIQPVKAEKRRKLFNKIPKRMLSCSGSVKACPMKKIHHRQTILGLSDDDKVIILNSESKDLRTRAKTTYTNKNKLKPIDILQLHEMKKAVLEIYTEKTSLNEDQHLVARLPKFVYNKESEICSYYQEIVRDLFEFNTRNVVNHSITIL